MTPVVRSKIQQISDYMQSKAITLDELHKSLDTNGDGVVDKIEFTEGISRSIMLPSLTRQDLGTIFDAIDLNNDKSLSLNEFSYYLQGAKLKKDQKKAKIDPATISELQTEINALFMQLSLGKNFVTGHDIFKVM
jgi:Ca2+-binding EF-hand superfamily protein